VQDSRLAASRRTESRKDAGRDLRRGEIKDAL
jgi:hypothetical protein